MKIIITENQFRLLTEGLVINDDNKLRRDPSGNPTFNTIYQDEEPIVDLSIGRVGMIEDKDGFKIDNALEINQMNAATQNMGHGTLAIEFLFNKLPRIQNIYIQCYKGPFGFWKRIGGKIVKKKKTEHGTEWTMIINRDNFFRSL